jgi:hypothetical protein
MGLLETSDCLNDQPQAVLPRAQEGGGGQGRERQRQTFTTEKQYKTKIQTRDHERL